VAVGLIAAVSLSLVAGLVLIPGPWSPVAVTGVDLAASSGCFIEEQGPGFTAGSGGVELFSGWILNSENRTCTVDSIGSSTPGFSVIETNLPLVVPPGGASISWQVELPLTYRGVLTFDFAGTVSSTTAPPATNASCPSPCVTTQIPPDLYQYHYGPGMPSAGIGLLGAAVGAGLAGVAFARRP
jgi:hypothetical protein